MTPDALTHAIAQSKRFTQQYGTQYTPMQAGDYWQNLAKEGYGAQGLRDMMIPQVQAIQGQYMNQRDQFLGGVGQRGLYDSSIRERGMAGLVGAREGAIGSAQADIWKQNQQVMMEGQKVLEDVRRFNVQNQFQSDQFNASQRMNYDQFQEQMRFQQAQLREQQRQAKTNFWGSLAGSVGGGLLGLVL